MAIAIEPYVEDHIPEVKLFNRRLAEGGAPPDFRFPESPVPRWIPKVDGRKVYNEFFLALENGKVRGTYVLKTQEFAFRETIRTVGYYHHPFSEGLVHKAYSRVGVQTLLNALQKQPLMYCLGMGGYDRPLPQMLIAMGWSHCLIPFYFKVVRAKAFLRNLQVLQSDSRKRLLANAATFTGLGPVAIGAYRMWKSLPFVFRTAPQYDLVPEFTEWTQRLWERSRTEYAMVAVRDPEALRVLYPAANKKLLKLRVSLRNEPVGWAVVADTQMREHPQYGNMRVGHLIDCLAESVHADAVVNAATRFLTEQGVDMVMSNQSHSAWRSALQSNGYFKGPSNFVFATSKKLTEVLGPAGEIVSQIHMNRGDGDGLYQYLG